MAPAKVQHSHSIAGDCPPLPSTTQVQCHTFVPLQSHHDQKEQRSKSLKPSTIQRREKSLSYLCESLYGQRKTTISIDEAGEKLGVQRRRMYEILNIMSSVGLVSRVKTSSYKWDGFSAMLKALAALKDKGMQREKSIEEPSSEFQSVMLRSQSTGKSRTKVAGTKKKAVATCLSERFIQIFLCHEFPQPIVLEDITSVFRQFFGDSNNALSRGRRLYDIANVFCTLGLVRKSVALDADTKKRKRLYTWCGPALDDAHLPNDKKSVDTRKRSTSDEFSPFKEEENRNAMSKRRKTKSTGNIPTGSRAPLKTLAAERNILELSKDGGGYVKPPPSVPWYHLEKSQSDKTTWGTGTSTPVHESSGGMQNSAKGSSFIESQVADMDSTIALKAEVGRLLRALEVSEKRGKELKKRVETQENLVQIKNLIELRSNDRLSLPNPSSSTNSSATSSPINGFVFTPYGRNYDKPARAGPALPTLEIEQETAQGRSGTPSNYLMAAASSLLSLTPNKATSHSSSSARPASALVGLPNLDTPDNREISNGTSRDPSRGTTNHTRYRNRSFESPSQTQHIFDTLSPLGNTVVNVWDEF